MQRSSKTNSCAAALLVLAALAPSTAAAQGRAQSLYQAVLDTGSHDRKLELGRQLGLLGGEGKSTLLRLLEDDLYWNREAAVEGLLLLRDAEADRALLGRLVDDHMVSDYVQRGFSRDLPRVLPLLAEVYPTLEKPEQRAILLDTVAAAAVPEGERFLRQVVRDGAGAEREVAFAGLVRHHSAGSREYILGLVDDRQLRTQVLSYLLENDGERSLPTLVEVTRRRESAANHLVACTGIARWGELGLKQEVLAAALEDDDEMRLQAALVAFRFVDTPPIRERLCRVVRTASLVTTRLLAGERLSELSGREAIPCLIPCLRETLPSRETTVVDTVSTALTAGLLRVLTDSGEMVDRKSIRKSKERIASGLGRLAGVELGTDYQAWLDWAVCNGYAVDDVNLIQRLYSGRPAARAQAVDCACRLLGVRDRRDLLARNPALAKVGEPELLLELTRQLLGRGVLVDQE